PLFRSQRRDHHDALYALEDVALPGLRLRDVEHDVAMAQHRAFRRTGRAAGVLEEREIGVAELDRLERMAAPALQRRRPADAARQAPVRYPFLHVLHDEIDDPALRLPQQ